MKTTMKLADIEVTMEDPDEKNINNLNNECLCFVNELVQSRIILESNITASQERAEDIEGSKPEYTENHIKPVGQMSNMYL